MKLFIWLGRRGLFGLVVLLALVAPVYADSAQIAIDSVRATDYPSVTARFTVTSARSEPLPVLKSDDFVVEENGRTIKTFNAYPFYRSPTSVAVVLALDISGSMNDEGKLVGAKKAAKDFISQLRSIDQVELLTFNNKVQMAVPFTTNKAVLNQGIDKLVADQDTALYDATDQAVSDVVRTRGTRVVIVLTDGTDTASKGQLAAALDLAKASQVPIYTIGLGSDTSDAVLTRIATETSGRYFKAPRAEDLAGVFKLLAQSVANEYELTYFSQLPLVPGQKVNVVIKAVPAQYTPTEGQFTYTMPAVVKPVTTVAIDPGLLRPVEDSARLSPAPAAPPLLSPSGLSPVLAAILTFAALVMLGGGAAVSFTNDSAANRLASFVTSTFKPTRVLSDNQSGGRIFSSILAFLAGLAGRVLPSRQIEQTRQALVLAGNPYGWTVEQFLGIRTLAGIVCAILGFLVGAPHGAIFGPVGAVALGAFGFVYPALSLTSKIKARQKGIFRAMPNALDLLAVTVEAGLGFDQALGEVCTKWQNDLTREFSIYLSEMQVGRDRREALRGITTRTGVPELSAFVSAVIQADELGTGIARTLMIQAEQVRIRRRQQAEKLAHEAAIKMVIPMVFLIFPAIFVVLLGPAIPQILTAFSNIQK